MGGGGVFHKIILPPLKIKMEKENNEEENKSFWIKEAELYNDLMKSVRGLSSYI